jgi:hypothetical protein
MWVADTSDKLYFGRQTRDLHGYEVCLADTATGEVTVLIEEKLNTYVEIQPLRLVNGGQELVWWSERDGWGHYYLYDAVAGLKTRLLPVNLIAGRLLIWTRRPGSFIFWPVAGKKVKTLILATFIELISTARA